MSVCRDIKEAINDIEYCLELVRMWGARSDDEVGEALYAIVLASKKISDYDKDGRPRSKREILGYMYKSVKRAINSIRYRGNDEEVLISEYNDDVIQEDSSVESNVVVKIIVERMPKELRRICILSMMGFTAEEIEAMTGISRGRQWRVRKEYSRRCEG